MLNMLIMITTVIGLAYWALRLMEDAVQRQEFSRMLAGMLVLSAAAGVFTVYLLMGDYLDYLQRGHDVSALTDW